MLQFVHNVRLDGTDDIGMILFAVVSFHGGYRHHILFSHPYIRFAPVLDMLTPKAHEPRSEDAPDSSQCCIRL